MTPANSLTYSYCTRSTTFTASIRINTLSAWRMRGAQAGVSRRVFIPVVVFWMLLVGSGNGCRMANDQPFLVLWKLLFDYLTGQSPITRQNIFQEFFKRRAHALGSRQTAIWCNKPVRIGAHTAMVWMSPWIGIIQTCYRRTIVSCMSWCKHKLPSSSATNIACNSNSNVTYLVSCWRPWTVIAGDIDSFFLMTKDCR